VKHRPSFPANQAFTVTDLLDVEEMRQVALIAVMASVLAQCSRLLADAVETWLVCDPSEVMPNGVVVALG